MPDKKMNILLSWHFLIDQHIIYKVNHKLRNEAKLRKENYMENNDFFDFELNEAEGYWIVIVI